MNDEEDKKEINPDDDFEDVSFVESTEDGDELPTKDVAKKLREEIKKLQKEKEEYLTGWQRAKADLPHTGAGGRGDERIHGTGTARDGNGQDLPGEFSGSRPECQYTGRPPWNVPFVAAPGIP